MTELDAIARVLDPAAGANNPAVLGWCLWDEPCTPAELATATRLQRWLRTQPATAARLPFVNLHPAPFPTWEACYEKRLAAAGGKDAAYRAYLDEYLSAFDGDAQPAPVLSFDLYPFLDPASLHDGWFAALEAAAGAARAHSKPGLPIPLWVVVQLSPYKQKGKPWPTEPTFAQTRWQVWSAVAYGAKSVSYYTLGAVYDPAKDEGFGDGLITRDGGRPTPRYAPLQQLNLELHRLGPTLMQLDWVATQHAERGRWRLDDAALAGSRSAAASRTRLAQFSGAGRADAMVGWLRHRTSGEDYALVVNKSLAATRTIRVELTAPADSVYRMDRAGGRPVLVATAATAFEARDLLAGGGELFRLVGGSR
jgi:hypothetical protein